MPGLAVIRLSAVAAAGLLVLVLLLLPPLAEDGPDELHAASTAAATKAVFAQAGTGASSGGSDLIIAFSLVVDRPVPLRRGDADDSAV
jgi:hypothetical protein